MTQPDLFRSPKDVLPLTTIGYFLNDPNQKLSGLPGLDSLYELSVDAYYTAIHAVMSELPIKEEIYRFIEKVKRAADRKDAAKAAFDRGDMDVLAVQRAAYKVQHEIHRLTGLLRFNPDQNGVFIARCGPDHFILPALAEHFTLRFGETPWAIIDKKRGLCLCRESGGETRLIPLGSDLDSTHSSLRLNKENEGPVDSWEELWRLYHRSVNNEGKKNLRLQRQFMPERYHEYLPEMK